MTEQSQNKELKPTGIFSIDKAIGIVLDSFARFDPPESTWKFIRILAYTTADEEIISECRKHSQETRHNQSLMHGERGFTDADRMSKANKIAAYIDGRNEDLYSLIMGLVAKKGYSQRPGLVGTSQLEMLENEDKNETEELPQ